MNASNITSTDARKEARKKLNQKTGQKIAAAGLIATAMQFWFAQLIVWGLSLYGIHSGIWGPWLILEGAGSAGIWVVAIGMMRAVRDLQNTRE